MSRWGYIIFLIISLQLIFVNPAGANGQLRLIIQKTESEFIPGKVNNIPFSVQNQDVSPLRIALNFEFPTGLNLLIPVQDFEINPNEIRQIVISFNIPSLYRNGKYSMKINVLNKENGNILISEIISFRVKEVENLSLEILQSPTYVMAGEDITASVNLKNLGNSTRTFSLEPYNCNINSNLRLTLQPGESSVVLLKTLTIKEATGFYSQGIGLHAMLNDATRKSVFQEVKVYPVKEAENDLWLRYPITLSARYVSREMQGINRKGYQIEAYGNGFLDVGNKHNLEFRARGPNMNDLSFLGLYDEYFVSYKNKYFESHTGDKSYNLTPLTEFSRYGRGTENTFITKNGTRIGGFYLQPRFFKDIKNEWAAYSNIVLYKENKIGFYFLNKTYSNSPQPALIGSISATINPWERVLFEAEYSQGEHNKIRDQAYRFVFNASTRYFNISGNYYHTGKNYPGYYNNSTFYNGHIQANLTESLNIGLSAREDFTNASLDTLFSSAPYTKMIMATLYYRFSQNLYLRTYYLNLDRKDRMPVKKFDYQSQTLNGELDHTIRRFGYQLQGELGNTINSLSGNGFTPTEQTTWRGSLYLRYKPTYLLHLSAFTSYTNLNSFIAPNQDNWLWGASVNGQPVKNLTVNFHVQNSYAIDNYYLNRNLFQLSAEYRFLKRHRISANSYYMLFQNKTENPDFTFVIGYSLDLGLPMKKIQQAGSLKGTLTGIDGEAVKNSILIMNGRSTITRDLGDFEFKNLAPGKYQLILDRKNLSMSDILTIPTPVTIDIVSDRETRMNLQITKAASVKGTIQIFQPESTLQVLKTELPNLENIVVEIKDSLETIRTITDENGRFSFPSLRPGNWRIRIYNNNIDNRYSIERENFDVALNPEENEEIGVILIPKVRKINFQATTLVAGKKSGIIGSTVNTNGSVKQESGKFKSDENLLNSGNLTKSEKIYAVQIASLPKPIVSDDSFLQSSPGIYELKSDGRYKYYIGKYSNQKDAIRQLNKIRNIYPGCFVVSLRHSKENQIPDNKGPIRPWLSFFKKSNK